MAARKKQKRVVRKTRTPRVTEKTLGESIIEQMVLANHALTCIVGALAERNTMLAVVTSETAKQTVAYEKVADTITEPAATAAEIDTALAPLKKKRGRPSKAELALRAAQVEGNPVKVEQTAFISANFPKMCPCGVREDVPKHLHAKGCPVHFPAEPGTAASSVVVKDAPEATPLVMVPPPTLDDVRATAIAFVGKHGKEKLAELLKKYAAEKLSSVAADKLPALLADLQAAG